MPELLSFEWERDRDGYRILRVPEEFFMDPEAYKFERPEWVTRSVLEAIAAVDTKWIEKGTEAEHAFLVPNGSASVRYRPLGEHQALFKDIADLEPSLEPVIDFANQYGLLFGRGGVEPLARWYEEIRNLSAAVCIWKNGEDDEGNLRLPNLFEAANIQSDVVVEKLWNADRPSLVIAPKTLRDALWLQFAQAVSGHKSFRRCAWCSTWFAYGTGTGRRKSAHYCSDRCRKAHHRHRETGGE